MQIIPAGVSVSLESSEMRNEFGRNFEVFAPAHNLNVSHRLLTFLMMKPKRGNLVSELLFLNYLKFATLNQIMHKISQKGRKIIVLSSNFLLSIPTLYAGNELQFPSL